MLYLKTRNANQALPEAMDRLLNSKQAHKQDSRNGKVTRFIGPMTIHYTKPLERVVFWPERDANPFFHFFESLWMMTGRNDVAFPAQFASQIAQYSDDGTTFHGAYGYRWRRHFAHDQLASIAEVLKKDPNDRRQVLQMWDPTVDGNGRLGKDFPCNISAVFNLDEAGRLNMVVYNRSNDLVWGALGANCVHFSFLQEYLAAVIGCPVGEYWQISANMHGYDFNTANVLPLAAKAYPSSQYRAQCPYECGVCRPIPLVRVSAGAWMRDLEMFMSEGSRALGYNEPFFRRLALPLLLAHQAYRNKSNPQRFDDALELLRGAEACDWKLACQLWIFRRKETAARTAVQPAA